MESQKITSNLLPTEIFLPGSKSFANRALLFGALSPRFVAISDIPKSDDVQEMLAIFKQLSLCKESDSVVHFHQSFPKDEVLSEQLIELDLGEGGTTIRFLTCLLALGKNKYKLKVNPRFKQRPYQDMLNLLRMLGAKIEESKEENILCLLKGPISLARNIEIDCSKTTQVATALLIISNFYPELKVELKGLKSSLAYIEMTKQYFLNSKEESFKVPADMSSAGYLIALSLFDKGHVFPQIKEIDYSQADSQIFNVLKQIGAKYSFTPSLSIVPCKEYKPFEIDGSQCLDLIPTLVVIASFINGVSVITNINGLKYKETDRLDGILKFLNEIEVKYEIIENSILRIFGRRNPLRLNRLKTSPDHRMIMSCSLYLKIIGGGEVLPSEHVSKSFPDFFKIIS